MAKDQLFEATPEWVEGGEISTLHSETGSKEYDLPYSYLLFVYPRAFSPVCNKELIEIQESQQLSHLPLIVASSDSPESQQDFYNNEEYFETPFIGASLTVNDRFLTYQGAELLINEHGYTDRAAVLVKEGKIVWHLRELHDEQRPINYIIETINKIKD